ncbi:transposase [Streptomyces sp. NBC_00645]|uniref:transposase n=1 Tax=Streptomyces sp. NBC_00645 TaxID=2975795 RepID=UPI0038646089
MAGRGELTEAAWERIEPLLPQGDGRGRPWRGHRQVVNGCCGGCGSEPLRDLPERYGPWQTVYERFARWEADGSWAKLLEHVQVHDDSLGRVRNRRARMPALPLQVLSRGDERVHRAVPGVAENATN